MTPMIPIIIAVILIITLILTIDIALINSVKTLRSPEHQKELDDEQSRIISKYAKYHK